MDIFNPQVHLLNTTPCKQQPFLALIRFNFSKIIHVLTQQILTGPCPLYCIYHRICWMKLQQKPHRPGTLKAYNSTMGSSWGKILSKCQSICTVNTQGEASNVHSNKHSTSVLRMQYPLKIEPVNVLTDATSTWHQVLTSNRITYFWSWGRVKEEGHT